MNKLKVTMLIISCIMLIEHAVASSPVQTITYFGNQEYPLDGREIDAVKIAKENGLIFTDYNLDGLKLFEKEISKGIPMDDLVEAEKIAAQRMKNIDEDTLNGYIEGPLLLVSWDIKKIPAFVFNTGEFVVYGVTDTATAIRHYQDYTGH